jgi:hypothetical protein
MGETALVESQIEDAVALVRKLDERRSAPSLAAWCLSDDDERWRLLIAGPTFDPLIARGLSLAYLEIVGALAEIHTSYLAGSQVKLIPTTSPLARAIGGMSGTDPRELTKAHYGTNLINGIFIKKMIVLRSAIQAA